MSEILKICITNMIMKLRTSDRELLRITDSYRRGANRPSKKYINLMNFK